jgi:PII-like signaling protein
MATPKQELLLRIFVDESDKYGASPLYKWIVRKAKEHGLSRVTVLRGKEGFGAHGKIHTAKIFRLSDQPIVIEIVDAHVKVDAFIPIIDGAITHGLAVLKEVEVRRYGRD